MNSKNLRILIPILGFAPQGGYRVLSQLANKWIEMGHSCTFIVPATSPDPYFPTQASIVRVDRKGCVHDARSAIGRSGFNNIVCLWVGLRKIGYNYDVWLANHSLTAWPVRFSGFSNAKKFYYIQAYEPLYYSILRDPLKKILSYGSYFLGLSSISNSAIYPLPQKLLENVIPPGVDVEVFYEKNKSVVRTVGDRVTFGTVGRAEPYKGTATAVAAYRLVRAKQEAAFLKVAIGNVEKSDDLSIHPIANDQELATFYRDIDVLIVACRGQHGAPHYPVIEAMACGTPVVHTGYFPGSKNNSWIANGTSAEEVAAAIEIFLECPEYEIMQRVKMARELVEKELSWQAVARQFLDVFLSR